MQQVIMRYSINPETPPRTRRPAHPRVRLPRLVAASRFVHRLGRRSLHRALGLRARLAPPRELRAALVPAPGRVVGAALRGHPAGPRVLREPGVARALLLAL